MKIIAYHYIRSFDKRYPYFNFLDKKLFNSIKKQIFSDSFGWYWQEHQYEKDKGFFAIV